MKLIIDENLSRLLLSTIGNSFPESTHVADQNLLKVFDLEIWDFAKQKGYCILTKYWDYKFMSMMYGCSPKVIHLNCGNKSTLFIADLMKNKTEVIITFLSDPENCYLEI